MRSRASASKPARLTIPSSSVRSSSPVIAASVPSDAGGLAADLAGQLEACQGGEQRLTADLRVPERDRDLLVAAGELRADDDAVTPAGVADAVPVPVAALAGHDRPVNDPRGRRGDSCAPACLARIVAVVRLTARRAVVVPRSHPAPERPGSCAAGERLASGGEVPRG